MRPHNRRQVRAHRVKTLGADDADTIDAEHDLAISLSNLAHSQPRHKPEAVSLYRRALAWHKEHSGAGHEDTLDVATNMGICLTNKPCTEADQAEAAALFQEVHNQRAKTLGEDHKDTMDALFKQADALADCGQFAQAAPLFQRVLAWQQKTLGVKDAATVETQGRVEWAMGGWLPHVHGQA